MFNYRFYSRITFLLLTIALTFSACGSDIALNEQQSTDVTANAPALTEDGSEQIFQEDSHGIYYSTATPIWKIQSTMAMPNVPANGWAPKIVAMGDEGRKVATAVGPYSAFTTILSSRAQRSDATNFVPETFETMPYSSAFFPRVAMSRNSDLTAFMYQLPDNQGLDMRDVRIFVRSLSRSMRYGINWTKKINAQEAHQILVTGDDRIVGVVKDITTSSMDVKVYNGLNGALINSFSVTGMSTFVDAKLSDDDQFLFLIATNRLVAVSLTTGATVFGPVGMFNNVLGQGDISTGGTYAAYCAEDALIIKKRGATGTYSDYHMISMGAGYYCQYLDFSDDASTVVVGFNYYIAGQRVDIMAIDLATRTTTMNYPVIGIGTLQNYVADIASSATGDRFIVGLWGDGTAAQGGGQAKEVYVFDKNISMPVAIHDMPGSAFQVAISADGRYATVAGKGTDTLNLHMNTLGSGGWVASFLTKATTDLMVRGNQWNSLPGQDNQVEIAVKAPPGSTVYLFKASSRLSANVGNQCLGSDKVSVESEIVPAGEQEVRFMRTLSTQTNQTEFYQAAVLLADMSRRWTNCERVTSIAR